MTNLNETIRTTAGRIFCGLEATLAEGATAEEKDRIRDLLHEGFDPADSYASVYIVPFLRDIAKDNGMTVETFEVDEEAVIDHFADQVRDLLEEEESTEGNTVRYFLDFDPFDQDAFCLMTTDGHDTVFEGRLSEIVEPGDDWQDALDRHFEKELGILPNEWEIG